jgi:hypothetical protein
MILGRDMLRIVKCALTGRLSLRFLSDGLIQWTQIVAVPAMPPISDPIHNKC